MLALAACSVSIVGTSWRLSTDIGRMNGNSRESLDTHPLAMFTPGGGRATMPHWFKPDWALSGARLRMPIDVTFGAQTCRDVDNDYTLRKMASRGSLSKRACQLSTGCGAETTGVAWGDMRITTVESLLVWSIDLPQGARNEDASLPAATRLFFSTRAWARDGITKLTNEEAQLREEVGRARVTEQGFVKGAEGFETRRRQEQRLKVLKQALPPRGCALAEVPAGPMGNNERLVLAEHGQISVMRLAPRGLRGALDMPGNPFEQVGEYGVA